MLGLRTTIYKVSNLEEATKWYSEVFGVQPYFKEPFYVGFNIAGYELGLLPEEESKTKRDNVMSYWGVEDIHKTHADVLQKGAKSHEEPTNVGGELMVASVIDPWNNVVGFIYNPYFKLPSSN